MSVQNGSMNGLAYSVLASKSENIPGYVNTIVLTHYMKEKNDFFPVYLSTLWIYKYLAI